MLSLLGSTIKWLFVAFVAGIITIGSVFVHKANPQPSNQIAQQSAALRQIFPNATSVQEKIAELEKEIAELKSSRSGSGSSVGREPKAASTQVETLQKQINALKSAPANAPKITFVNPSIIIAGFENTISINGSDFQGGAKVKLGDTYLQVVGDTTSTFISVKYPSGFNPGLYDITVVNPDNSQFTFPGAITIRPGSPTPVNQTLSTSQIVQKVSPAVVLIRTNIGCGSGMVLTSDGYILTNNHVISGASSINIYFSSGSTSNGSVVGNNASEDLALLKVPLNGLATVTLGSSAEAALPLGSEVVALGYPLTCSQDQTLEVETGNITARRSSYLGELLQTSARVNPGNSGGPLVDNRGDVVGINTLAVTIFGLNLSGIAFAIPSDTVKPYLNTLGLPNTQFGSGSVTQTQPSPLSNNGTLNVILNVDNIAGGTATPSAFTVTIIAGHPNPSSFSGSPSGTKVTIDSDQLYFVNVSSMKNYVLLENGNCNNNKVFAGESVDCVITETYIPQQ